MNRKDALKHKSKKNYKLGLIIWCIILCSTSLIVMLGFALLDNLSIPEILLIKEYWLTVGVVNGSIIAFYLLMYRIDAQNIALKGNDLEDTEWLTPKKLKKLKEFDVRDWNDLSTSKDGIVIGAEKKGTKLEITTTSQLHALIVGTTGSGKTTGFVDQNIEVLANSKSKPSLVITDPKKELFEKHCKQLEALGYNISVLDLREPYSSQKWNPMNVLTRRIRLVKELENNLKSQDGKYYGAGEVFLSYKEARARVQELKDEIFENAQDLVYTLCPVQNHNQPTWEEGARNLIFGLVLAFCEDCIKGKMEEKQLLLFNIYHNIAKYCSEDITVLKKYLLEGRDEYSKVRGLVNTVLITSDKTLTSYLSEVNAYIHQLSDDGILSLTSENEIDILNMDESPNATFVIVPDERFTRHRFVTLFITQMYKELVEKANLNARKKEMANAILKRNTYFVLDEFANLPKFENIEGMVTVARSRGIRFLFVLQSYSQLSSKYGKDIADIIKTNCNVKIFIGSDDSDTRKEFSELCGNKKIKNFSVNTSMENSATSNTGATTQPLITMGMLERLNGDEKGDAIVSVRGYEPIWSKFTPSYELKHIYFSNGNADQTKREAVLFEKANYVFDINNPNGISEEEKILEEIEQREKASEIAEDERKQLLTELDKKWEKVVKEIERKIDLFAILLNGRDRKMIKSARLEDKATLLYALMENYDQSTALKMQELADYITGEALPKLAELQESATKI